MTPAGRAEPNQRRHLPDAFGILALALVVRLLIVLWAKDRFPPADDGAFYHVVAQRIAQGAGYTWLWPDGAVTYAAHYPVGYPALLGVAYAALGPWPVTAMMLNAGIGALAAFAAQRAVIQNGARAPALLAALLVALHPGLVFYTPALMTEGVAAELLVVGVWLALRVPAKSGHSGRRLLLLALCTGSLSLIRPQLLVMAPILGFFTVDPGLLGYRQRLLRAFTITALSVGLCLPWTLRNCARMDRCVFVSANGGWNLLIGAMPQASGAWAPIEGDTVPEECRHVFGEAEKDRCFGHAGWERIRRAPLAFLRLVPRKLSVTFDYFGAPGHYLHTSNWQQFDEAKKLRLGIIETVWERLVLLLAIVRAARWREPGRALRLLGAVPAALLSLTRWGYLGYLGFVLTAALSGKQLLKTPLSALSALAVLTTALTHALFFGAGRYGFVCAGVLCLAAVGSRAGVTRARAAPVPAE